MITAENYFCKSNNILYMGSSQFKSFLECEAKALAEVHETFTQEKTTSQLIGSYVDTYFSGTLEKFKSETPQIFTQKGELKKDYEHAEYIIERIKRDELFMKYISGKKQVIQTGLIAGVPFKTRIDSYHILKAIVDLKIMKDMEPIYKPGAGRLNFIEAWGYDIQGAIYQEVEYQTALKINPNAQRLPFFIAVATKEKEPDIEIIQIDQLALNNSLEVVKEYAPRFQAIKEGKIEPVRCGKCDYCKRTKILTGLLTIDELNERNNIA